MACSPPTNSCLSSTISTGWASLSKLSKLGYKVLTLFSLLANSAKFGYNLFSLFSSITLSSASNTNCLHTDFLLPSESTVSMSASLVSSVETSTLDVSTSFLSFLGAYSLIMSHCWLVMVDSFFMGCFINSNRLFSITFSCLSSISFSFLAGSTRAALVPLASPTCTSSSSESSRPYLENPRACDRVVVNELGVHVNGGFFYLLAVSHCVYSNGVCDGHAGLFVRGPNSVQGDFSWFVKSLADWGLLGVVWVDMNLLAAYVDNVVQVEIGQVGEAWKSDAAVVDSADGKIFHQTIAAFRVDHGAQFAHGRNGKVARSLQNNTGRVRHSRQSIFALVVGGLCAVIGHIGQIVGDLGLFAKIICLAHKLTVSVDRAVGRG
ncbi:hypothetical protein BpHYR1_016234 [Brachionus plicatilis]|uniref:Transmembrane protein n=1 Tax=Brachionus plicatilis TaxID=10195 RepID=A0A3M7RJ43_BRAPC|nr:hypothetical protein BpHYR1_016234 [Brachionus plicatilis]